MSDIKLNLLSFSGRIRTLHLTWFAFFLSFMVWFNHAPLMAAIQQSFDLSTQEVKALLIINDAAALCRASGAQGVHLGEDDLSLEQARTLLGPDAIIGISCYNDLGRAHQAAAQGADYVAFGAIFPSTTKPLARRAGLELLRQARKELHLPLVAIGGITPENAPSVIETGVDMLAMIQGLFAQPDLEKAARRIDHTFKAFRGNP